MAFFTTGFDPYRKWLGIPEHRRPPTYYSILGISRGENDDDVIRSAAEQRRNFIQSKFGEGHDKEVTKILREIDESVACLLVPTSKHEYDRRIGLTGKNKGKQKNHPLPPWFDYFPVRIYGEGSGIISSVAGIMLVICLCIGAMFLLSSSLPMGKLSNRDVDTPTVGKSSASQRSVGLKSEASPTPDETPELEVPLGSGASQKFEPKPVETAVDTSDSSPRTNSQAVQDMQPSSAGSVKKTVQPGPTVSRKPPEGWRVIVGPKHQHVPSSAWSEDVASAIIEAEPIGFCELATVANYLNFSLSFDWRFKPGEFVGENGSGVVLRSTGWNAFGLDPKGIEVDLRPNDSPNGYVGTGCMIAYDTQFDVSKDRKKDRHIKRLKAVSTLKDGTWSQCRIECKGDRIEVFMNGELINYADGLPIVAGPICLRSQRAAVQFRNLQIVDNGTSNTRLQSEWLTMFDGTTLNGWKTGGDPNAWQVENGTIVCSGERSHLFYVGGGSFKNFHLKCDAKCFSGSNSGIYFHTRFEDQGFPKLGFECQIDNRDRRKTGSLYGLVDVTNTIAQDGKWFTLEIIVKGNRITISVDGQVVVDYTEPENQKPASAEFDRRIGEGIFALQSNSPNFKTYFRDLRVKRLADSVAPTGQASRDAGVVEESNNSRTETKSESLLLGNNLSQWQGIKKNDDISNWIVESGVLKLSRIGPSIRTKEVYRDFDLHLEFKLPAENNTGVFLRGRYEVQLLDSLYRSAKGEPAPPISSSGAIYGQHAPSKEVYKGPNQWNTLDMRLIGDTVTIVMNSVTIIESKTLSKVTAGALDENESDPGPILLQAHGTAGQEFRNITIKPILNKDVGAAGRVKKPIDLLSTIDLN